MPKQVEGKQEPSPDDGFQNPEDLATSCHACRASYRWDLNQYRRVLRVNPQTDPSLALSLETKLDALPLSACSTFLDKVTVVDGACSSCKHPKEKHGMKERSSSDTIDLIQASLSFFFFLSTAPNACDACALVLACCSGFCEEEKDGAESSTIGTPTRFKRCECGHRIELHHSIRQSES
jgi:hypothetical protein